MVIVHVGGKGFIYYLQGLLVALWASDKPWIFLFQSLATHMHAHTCTHTHTHPSILSSAVRHAEVTAPFAFPLVSEGPIHIHSICVPGVL